MSHTVGLVDITQGNNFCKKKVLPVPSDLPVFVLFTWCLGTKTIIVTILY